MILVERKPAQEAREKRDRPERLVGRVDPAQFAGAGIQDPEPAIMYPRTVRHRQAFGDDFVAVDIDDDTAIVTPIPPAVDHVRPAHGSDIFGLAIDHREAVEVAAVLGCQPADEVRLPDRPETVRDARFAQAAVAGVDEDDIAISPDTELVNIDIAGRLHVARNINPVMHLVGALVGAKDIFHPDDLCQGAEIDAIGIADHTHRLRIYGLMQGQLAVRTVADQVEPSGLIGGKADREICAGQKSGQPLGKIDVDPATFRRNGGRHRGRAIAIFRADCLGIRFRLFGLLVHARFPSAMPEQEFFPQNAVGAKANFRRSVGSRTMQGRTARCG